MSRTVGWIKHLGAVGNVNLYDLLTRLMVN